MLPVSDPCSTRLDGDIVATGPDYLNRADGYAVCTSLPTYRVDASAQRDKQTTQVDLLLTNGIGDRDAVDSPAKLLRLQ